MVLQYLNFDSSKAINIKRRSFYTTNEQANIKEALVTAAIPYLISQKKDVSNDVTHGYFLFPVPIVRRSKLRRVSSRLPLVATARVKEDDLDSNPGCNLWVVDKRPLPVPSQERRFSLGSPDELGRLLDITTLFEVLTFLDKRPLSESFCCRMKRHHICVIGSIGLNLVIYARGH